MFVHVDVDGRSYILHLDLITWVEWEKPAGDERSFVKIHFAGGQDLGIRLESDARDRLVEMLREHKHHLERAISDGIRGAGAGR
jgi:hypothetical protein